MFVLGGDSHIQLCVEFQFLYGLFVLAYLCVYRADSHTVHSGVLGDPHLTLSLPSSKVHSPNLKN